MKKSDNNACLTSGSGEAASFDVRQPALLAFRWGWIAFMVLATSLPYLWAFWNTPSQSHYTWILPPYPEDSLAYRAWSLQAAHGQWLFQLKYTALPHAPFLFQPFFLVCGWLSALFSCDVGIIHCLVKAAGVVWFFWAFYRYADFLGLSGMASMVASVLAGVASGVGALLAWTVGALRWPAPPADLWVVDINIYWSLLWNPLFPWALALMVLVFHRLDRGTASGRGSDLWVSGLATGIMALIHPYSVPLLFAAAMGFAVIRQKTRAWTALAKFCLAAAPFVIYPVLVSVGNPLVVRHDELGAMKTPTLMSCLLGFGLLLPLGATVLALNRGRFVRRYWAPGFWFVLSLGMAWLPVWYQRKFLFGAQIPLCLLAAVSCDWILQQAAPAARRLALAAGAVVLLPVLVSTPVFLLKLESRDLGNNAGGAYYVQEDLWDALQYLRANTSPREVVFATYETSRLIPAIAGNTVVWGHWAMSVDGKERAAWLGKLFDDQSPATSAQRSEEFWNSGIRYFLADGRMQHWLAQTPSAWPLLQSDVVFSNRSTAIYRRRSP